MNPHTTWYPADTPDDRQLSSEYSIEEQPFSTTNIPFRFVTFSEGAPYPTHEAPQSVGRPFMIDLENGDQWHRSGALRQPIAEDFHHLKHTFPQWPVEERYSGQESPIMGTESAVDHWPASYQLEDSGAANFGERIAITAPSPVDSVEREPVEYRSKIAPELSLAVPRPHSPPESNSTDDSQCLVRIPSIRSDFYSPVLGGLKRVSSTPPEQSKSKSKRFKQFFSFRRRRKYGRKSR